MHLLHRLTLVFPLEPHGTGQTLKGLVCTLLSGDSVINLDAPICSGIGRLDAHVEYKYLRGHVDENLLITIENFRVHTAPS